MPDRYLSPPPMTIPKLIQTICLLVLAGTLGARAGLLAYEPFDYPPDLTDPALGAQDGKGGGTGFAGGWEDMRSGSNAGEGFIYDSAGNTTRLQGDSPLVDKSS
jgi:hypothetical protein